MKLVLTLLFALGLGACGDSGGTPSPDTDATLGADSGNRSDAASADARIQDSGGSEDVIQMLDAVGGCGAPIDVASPEQVAALAPPRYGDSGAGVRRLSTGELQAITDFVLTPADFPLPLDCPGDCEQSLFGPNFPGIERQSDTGSYSISAGARFRLRFTLPGGAPAASVVFTGSCAAGCESTEDRCDADLTCYSRGVGYCRLCDEQPRPICACRDAVGDVQADGEDCEYFTGAEVEAGTCLEGSCILSD